MNTCCINIKFAERDRIMKIVKSCIGFAALDSDLPDDVPIQWIRDLWETINHEVDKGSAQG